MKRIDLFSLIASAIGLGLISTAAFSQGFTQLFPNFDVGKAMETAGQKVFADHCAVCHAQKVGVRVPSGRASEASSGDPPASVAGFPYSDALKKSGLTWTEDNLRAWIADPSHTVPGHASMTHISLSDPAEQLYVIAYLKTLSGKATR